MAMMSINGWAADFYKEYGVYNKLPQELKDFVKKALKNKVYESGKYLSLLDYYNYCEHPIKYRMQHLFKGGVK